MLIKCTVYKNGIKHNEFPLSDIAQFLNKPEYIIWAAFRDANKEELNQIQDIFDLHEVVMEETNEVDQRPRMAEYTNAIYLSSHLLTFTQGKVETGEMSLLVGSNYVLTFRKRSERQFLGMRERCENMNCIALRNIHVCIRHHHLLLDMLISNNNILRFF